MENVKRIPYGVSNFVEVVEQNQYYVDKTMYLPMLEEQPNSLFLIRPRRFGKSIFLSMLRAYYDINQKGAFQKRFGNLWIGSHPTPLQGKFQILYLDFSRVGGFGGTLAQNFDDYCSGGLDDFAQIYFDHFKIGINAAKVLAGYGHKKVVHITGPDTYASALYRKNGFIRGSRKNGIDYVILESKMNFRGGYALADQVSNLVMIRKFTAVFAANDWMAIGLIQALRTKGIEVPDQVSVLSVDNIPLASQFAPALTTYSLDANMMIAECFSLMDAAESRMGSREENNVMDEQKFHKRVILQPILITRDTLIKQDNPFSGR